MEIGAWLIKFFDGTLKIKIKCRINIKDIKEFFLPLCNKVFDCREFYSTLETVKRFAL